MLIRKCSAGYDISIWGNGLPLEFLPKLVGDFKKGKYILISHGDIIKRSDDFKKIMKSYHKECGKYHTRSEPLMGDIVIGKSYISKKGIAESNFKLKKEKKK